MPTYVLPAVYDTVKKQIRPISTSERLLPEYFGLSMPSLLSQKPGQALYLDANGLLYCTVVSQDSRNLIVYGSDHGAYIDASQILSNAATNLLTVSPTDFRVVLTKQVLLDAGLADATTVYSAMQQHIATIQAAKESAAESEAKAKSYSDAISHLATEAESVLREEAAGIAASAITNQVVQRAAEAAVPLIDTRQDRELAALTSRVTSVENTHSSDVVRIDRSIASANDEIITLSANWSQNFVQVTRVNVEQSEQLAQLFQRVAKHDERLNFLKCSIDALDARVYQNFVCLVYRISAAEDRLNTRITTEVTRLDNRITTEVTRLDAEIIRINATQAAAWSTISRTEAEIAEHIFNDEIKHRADVEQLNTRITTEVTRLDDLIIKTNAVFTDTVASIAETDTLQAVQIAELRSDVDSTDRRLSEHIVDQKVSDIEQAVQIAELRSDVDSTDRRLSENIVMQNKRYVEQSEIKAELSAHQLNDAVRFSDLSYASVVHTRELLSLDSGFASLCANVVSLVRASIEQTFAIYQLLQHFQSLSVIGITGSGVDLGSLG